MGDTHEFRTAQGATIRTERSPEGDEISLTIALDGRADARRVTAFMTPEEYEEITDGHHSFAELYRYRMLYHAAFVNQLERNGFYSVKSLRHSDGELCFGGGWFIVVTHLYNGRDGNPSGQISNHYETKHWDLFQVPSIEIPPPYDGHTSEQAADRLEEYLRREWMRTTA